MLVWILPNVDHTNYIKGEKERIKAFFTSPEGGNLSENEVTDVIDGYPWQQGGRRKSRRRSNQRRRRTRHSRR